MLKIISILSLLLLPVFAGPQGFSLDAYSEKAEQIAQSVMKEMTWSTVKTREELLLEYIGSKDKVDPLRLFYCAKQIVQKKEESIPEIMKVASLTDNEDKFAGIILPMVYTKDRRVAEPLRNIIEDKSKSMRMRGLSAAVLATYVKSDAYAKEKWKMAKQTVFTSEYYRLEKEQEKDLLKFVDNLKYRDDIGVDMFLWIKPGIFDFVQPVENADILKEQEKKNKKAALLKDLKSDKKEKRENALYSMLNLPFPGRDKLLEGVSKTDSDPIIKKTAKLYIKLIERVKQEKTPVPEVKTEPVPPKKP